MSPVRTVTRARLARVVDGGLAAHLVETDNAEINNAVFQDWSSDRGGP